MKQSEMLFQDVRSSFSNKGVLNSYDHFKLSTDVKPYYIELIYSVPTNIVEQYEDNIKDNTKDMLNPLRQNAWILLSLIHNADEIHTTFTDGKRSVTFINYRERVNRVVFSDIRNYAESPEKLLELTHRLRNE